VAVTHGIRQRSQSSPKYIGMDVFGHAASLPGLVDIHTYSNAGPPTVTTTDYSLSIDQQAAFPACTTVYCVLAEHGEVRERRRQLRRLVYQKPELLPEGPNQV